MQVIKNAIKDSFFLSEYVFGCQLDPEERGLSIKIYEKS